jgi:hypothetical protein
VADYCPISIDAPIRGMDIMEPPAGRDSNAPTRPENKDQQQRGTP